LGAPTSATVTIADDELALKSVTFDNSLDIQQDGTVNLYEKTEQWKDNNNNGSAADVGVGDQRFPVAYVRGSQMSISAKIRIPNGYVPNKAKATSPDGTVPFTVDIGAGDINGNTLTTPAGTVTLPNTIKFYNPYKIDWYTSSNGGTTWSLAGRSDNRVYVTLATPETATPYESLYDIGARNADGFSEPSVAAFVIWYPDFAKPVIPGVKRKAIDGFNKVDGKSMQYWPIIPDQQAQVPAVQNLCQHLPAMINPSPAAGDPDSIGTCGAWAELLDQTWKVMGIPGSDYTSVWPRQDRGDTEAPDGIMVKNWTFKSPGNFPNSRFKYVLGDHVTEAPGVPGQNNPNPPSWFSDHAVVKLSVAVSPGPNGVLNSTAGGDDVVSGNVILVGPNARCDTLKQGDDIQVIPKDGEAVIYDPSYGTSFASEKSWENGSLDGMYKNFAPTPRGRPLDLAEKETVFNVGSTQRPPN
jgi:hypothetical protein